MSDSEILELAKSVREWAKSEAEKNRCPSDTLAGMCAVASLEIARRLDEAKQRYEIAYANTWDMVHVWVEVRGRILDVTATQLDGPTIYYAHRRRTSWWQYGPEYRYPTAGMFMAEVYSVLWKGNHHAEQIRDYYESRA